jgi:hypothetical protein
VRGDLCLVGEKAIGFVGVEGRSLFNEGNRRSGFVGDEGAIVV